MPKKPNRAARRRAAQRLHTNTMQLPPPIPDPRSPQSNSTRPAQPPPPSLTLGPNKAENAKRLVKQAAGWIWTALKWTVINGLAVLGGISVFFDFSPKVSVSAYQALEPRDAFSAPFIVSNDGYLALRDVSMSCVVNEADFGKSGNATNNRFTAEKVDLAHAMMPGEKLTVMCRLNQVLTFESPLEGADVQIVIRYKPVLWPYQLDRQFRFVTAKASDASMHWLPQPIGQ